VTSAPAACDSVRAVPAAAEAAKLLPHTGMSVTLRHRYATVLRGFIWTPSWPRRSGLLAYERLAVVTTTMLW